VATDIVTKKLIELYNSEAEPTRFLTGFFRTPSENFHNSQEVELDIIRSDEEVSVVIQDLSQGYRMNSNDIYTTKSFIPPIHQEALPINAYDALKRAPGRNPFEDVGFQTVIADKALRGFRKLERKIRRAIELQSSQVLQTGAANLINADGAVIYTIDYLPKASHFPTAAVAWDNPAADIIGDLMALATAIRTDGLVAPNILVMGEQAFENAMANTAFLNRLDNRRIDLGMISPLEERSNQGQFRGRVDVGNYQFNIWTYNGYYRPANGTAKQQYVDPNNVIMMSSDTRLDATYGAIPFIAPPDSRVMPFIPSRISNTEGGIDMFTNAWISPDGQQLFAGIGSRPLMIPTAIDTFGCLDTIP